MTRQFDEKTLSAFLDGELDDLAMQEVDGFIQQDGEAQKFLLNAARATAFLKAASNVILHEKVPDDLIDTVKQRRVSGERPNTIFRPVLHIAAAIILVFIGFGASSLLKNEPLGPLATPVAPVLEQYAYMVDEALENNLSGNPRKWSEPRRPMIMVTPIKTFRDRNNIYFREYRLEVVTENYRQRVSGVAYRTGGGRWITKALYFEDKKANDS